MSYEELRLRILANPIAASDGSHTERLWRIAENMRAQAQVGRLDERMLHIMSRVAVLCRGLSRDLRDGHTSAEDTASLLEQLARLGLMSSDDWSSSELNAHKEAPFD